MLAHTGLVIPPYVIPVAVGIVVLGIVLMVVSLLQRRRNNRADSEGN
jgi:Flp pilus assembly protein protease CpaA